MTAETSKESLNIQTPEQLISELRQKSKNVLAGKVENVINGIKGETNDKWNKLKDSLTPKEAQEIVETFQKQDPKLKDKIIKPSLKGAVAKVAGATGVGGVALAAAEKFGFMDTLGQIWDKFGDMWDKFIKKIGTLLAKKLPFLAKFFDIEVPENHGEEAQKNDGEQTGSGDDQKYDIQETQADTKKETTETIKDLSYTKMIDHIYWKKNNVKFDGWWDSIGKAAWDGTFGEDEKKQKDDANKLVIDIINSDTIKNLSFQELQYYKNCPQELNIAKIEDPKTQKAAKLAIESILDNEEWINENLSNILPNWKTRPLFESINALYKGIGFEKIDKIKGIIEGIDWSNKNDVVGKIQNMVFSKNSNGTYGGLVGDKIESLKSKGFNHEIVEKILLTKDGDSEVVFYRKNTLINSSCRDVQAQNFLTEITKEGGFSKDILNVMGAFGFKDHIGEFNNGDSFTMKELLTLYAVSGGKTDLDSMTKGECSELYMTILFIIMKRKPISVTTDKLLEFANSPTNKYIGDIAEYLGSKINEGTYKGLLKSLELGEDAIKALGNIKEKNPKVFYGIIAAMIFSLVLGCYFKGAIITIGIAWNTFLIAAGVAGFTALGSSGK